MAVKLLIMNTYEAKSRLKRYLTVDNVVNSTSIFRPPVGRLPGEKVTWEAANEWSQHCFTLWFDTFIKEALDTILK